MTNTREKIILLILAALQFTHIVDFMLIMPLGDTLMKVLSISPHQFSLIVGFYAIAAGISSLIFSFYSDKFDRRLLLLISYAGFCIGTICCGFADNYYMLLFMRALTGTFGGLLSSTVFSIVSDLIPFERRASAMGIIMSAFSISSIVGVPLGIYFSTNENWTQPFFVLGGFSVIIWFLIYFFIPSVNSHIKKESNSFEFIFSIFKNSNLITALSLSGFLILGQFTVISFISPFLQSNLHFSKNDLMYFYIIGGTCTIITGPLIGYLADKYSKKTVFNILAIISLLPLYIFTNLVDTSMFVTLLVSISFFILVTGRMIPATAVITETVPSQNRGSFMSINSATQQFTLGFASQLSGLLLIKNSQGIFENFYLLGYVAIFFSIIAIFTFQKLHIFKK